MLTPGEIILEQVTRGQTQSRANNPFLVFGNQMSRAPRPAYRGGGFWENFAAQAVPAGLGAVSTYLGNQQEQAKQRGVAQMLGQVLNSDAPVDIQIAQLAEMDPELALKYRLATDAQAQGLEQEITRAQRVAEAQYEHGGGQERLEYQKDHDQTMLGLQREQLAAQYQNNSLSQKLAELEAVAKQEQFVTKEGLGISQGLKKDPLYRQQQEREQVYGTLQNALMDDSKVSDMDFIRGIVQVWEPGLAVREGEMEQVKNSQGVPDIVKGYIKSIEGGAALSMETREALLRSAGRRVKQGRKARDTLLNNARSDYTGIGGQEGSFASRFGVDTFTAPNHKTSRQLQRVMARQQQRRTRTQGGDKPYRVQKNGRIIEVDRETYLRLERRKNSGR